MRIALLHPTYWPEVRRGSERLVHDLGATLARRGHQVGLITTHAAAGVRSREDGIDVYRGRRAPEIPGLTWYYDEGATALPATLLELARSEADVVHALYPTDGFAASLRRRRGGAPYVLSVHGIVDRTYLVRRRRRLEWLVQAAADAAAVSTLSEAAARPLRHFAIADPIVLPGGVIASDYAAPVSRPAEPVLLCAASLDDPRKRGRLLAAAFALLRERRPGVRLRLAGGRDPRQREPAPLELADGIERVEVDAAGLAREYATATATVLPADDEAFGLVLVESLAAGTPVVAARSGACPEIVTDDRIGRLFEPGDAVDLARALGEAIDLAADPGCERDCREHASAWDWDRVVKRYEAVYEAAAAGDSARRAST